VTHRRLLRIAQAVRRLLRLRARVRVPRHVARLVACLVTPLVVDYFASAARPGALTHRAARRAGSSSTTSPTPHVRVPRHVAWLVTPLVVDYFASAARPGASAHRAARRAGSSLTTSPTPRVRLLRHVARLVAWLVMPLVVDYFASVACLGASAHRVARHAAPRRLLRLAQARRRLLRLRHTSGCLGTSRGSSRSSASTASPMSHVRVPGHVARLVSPLAVNYFASAARPVPRHVARLGTQTRRRLLHLRRASGCFGTSRSFSRDPSSTTSHRAGCSSTTSPKPRVRVPRLVAQLVA
jgi:hypothetical protein